MPTVLLRWGDTLAAVQVVMMFRLTPRWSSKLSFNQSWWDLQVNTADNYVSAWVYTAGCNVLMSAKQDMGDFFWAHPIHS